MHRRSLLATATAFLAAPALVRAAEPEGPLKIRELYEKTGDMSQLALGLEGERVSFEGYMAPPLKADAQFFVLTKRPMAVCPFCESSAEWPSDILAVYTKRVIDVIPFNVGIESRGVLEIGEYKDPETGFVSMVRLTDATYSD
ncbi:hypothetical protein LVO79_10360 [Roseivivax marinus]|jgi:hypothetical protein|uniref:hypothetical protein n=1 Tax=Roseivivax marinus TaxID=1379903 RepID=UPI001F032F94|nr:hypothetical protein [Roseivivax marinus]UMA63459.1 hypothetical protein LVO79_10360 [Roseivivax marinus]